MSEILEESNAVVIARAEMIGVIKGQRQEAGFSSLGEHKDLFCHENERHQLTEQMGLREFADHALKLGWSVISVERDQVLCPVCVDPPPVKYWNDIDERIDELDNFGE